MAKKLSYEEVRERLARTESALVASKKEATALKKDNAQLMKDLDYTFFLRLPDPSKRQVKNFDAIKKRWNLEG